MTAQSLLLCLSGCRYVVVVVVVVVVALLFVCPTSNCSLTLPQQTVHYDISYSGRDGLVVFTLVQQGTCTMPCCMQSYIIPSISRSVC